MSDSRPRERAANVFALEQMPGACMLIPPRGALPDAGFSSSLLSGGRQCRRNRLRVVASVCDQDPAA